MSHTHTVVKPFRAEEAGRIVQVKEPFTPRDEVRAADLERAGLIVPQGKALDAAPQNKDAAKLRRNK